MRLIERSQGHRAGYQQLIRELGLGGGRERRLLLEQLARITARGELVKTDSEQWSLPAATPEKTKRVKRGGVEMPSFLWANMGRKLPACFGCHAEQRELLQS